MDAKLKEVVRTQLATNRRWQLKALQVIYSLQTTEEQKVKGTKVHNGVGFTAFDAQILTDLAEKSKFSCLQNYHYGILAKRLPKYWRQIIQVSDTEKLQKFADSVGKMAKSY
jgi:hypothetical protein